QPGKQGIVARRRPQGDRAVDRRGSPRGLTGWKVKSEERRGRRGAQRTQREILCRASRWNSIQALLCDLCALCVKLFLDFRQRHHHLNASPADRTASPAKEISMSANIRKLQQVIQSIPTSDGAGVRLRRSLGQSAWQRLDPFLMLDEFSSENADDYIAGFPSHPPPCTDSVTYMLDPPLLPHHHPGIPR